MGPEETKPSEGGVVTRVDLRKSEQHSWDMERLGGDSPSSIRACSLSAGLAGTECVDAGCCYRGEKKQLLVLFR